MSVAVLIALTAGCTTIISGSAVKSGGPGPPAADVALLDPGNYPRRPRPPLGTVANADAGRVVEAHRMANNVVGPWEVDPSLVNGLLEQVHTTALPDAAFLTVLFPDLAPIAAAHHFLLGFSSGRSSVLPSTVLDIAVLRFATAGDAAAAATEMAAKNLTLPRDGVAATVLPIPRYPSTAANMAVVRQGFEAESFTAHGNYAFYLYAGSKDNPGVVVDLITKTLDLQQPLIDHFQATPADQFASLPMDPTGLLARTVPSAKPDVNQAAVYEAHAALHFSATPTASLTMFSKAGVQLMSADRTTVLQAVDPAGASKALESMLLTLTPWGDYQAVSGINGLPSAHCFARGPKGDQAIPRFMCIAAADRYAFKVSSNQDVDARQAIASQYLMLTS
ncbi:DUF7373 family lipoprotein [Mycobacterium simiae]|uniref:DUF7373 family lipoprotein n=1 Tax=Mycobacterium simiae TaxID=1784 RepID=UPI0021CDE610|nr:hypothetical protein [Mycobacterium simiae]